MYSFSDKLTDACDPSMRTISCPMLHVSSFAILFGGDGDIIEFKALSCLFSVVDFFLEILCLSSKLDVFFKARYIPTMNFWITNGPSIVTMIYKYFIRTIKKNPESKVQIF